MDSAGVSHTHIFATNATLCFLGACASAMFGLKCIKTLGFLGSLN